MWKIFLRRFNILVVMLAALAILMATFLIMDGYRTTGQIILPIGFSYFTTAVSLVGVSLMTILTRNKRTIFHPKELSEFREEEIKEIIEEAGEEGRDTVLEMFETHMDEEDLEKIKKYRMVVGDYESSKAHPESYLDKEPDFPRTKLSVQTVYEFSKILSPENYRDPDIISLVAFYFGAHETAHHVFTKLTKWDKKDPYSSKSIFNNEGFAEFIGLRLLEEKSPEYARKLEEYRMVDYKRIERLKEMGVDLKRIAEIYGEAKLRFDPTRDRSYHPMNGDDSVDKLEQEITERHELKDGDLYAFLLRRAGYWESRSGRGFHEDYLRGRETWEKIEKNEGIDGLVKRMRAYELPE